MINKIVFIVTLTLLTSWLVSCKKSIYYATAQPINAQAGSNLKIDWSKPESIFERGRAIEHPELKNHYKSRVILYSGDTLNGYVNYDRKMLFRTVKFIDKDDNSKKRYPQANVKMFRMDGFGIYVNKSKFGWGSAFLKLEVQGRLKLYKEIYYITETDYLGGTSTSSRKMITDYFLELEDGTLRNITLSSFKKVVSSNLNDPVLKEKVLNKELKFGNLQAIIVEDNEYSMAHGK